MKRVLTLVNTDGLLPGFAVTAADFLRTHGAVIHAERDYGLALDLEFSGGEIEAILPGHAEDWQVDYALQRVEFRQKKLLISDMESTLVENEFLDDIAALAGVGEKVREITARAMNGEIDFAGALRERLALLKGQPVGLLEQAWAGLRWMPGARELVATLKAKGVPVVVVSGGFKFFTSRVRGILGAERDEANDLEIAAGILTGNPLEPILGRENKQRILQETAAALGLDIRQTAAVGDGANDLPMIQAAGLGVAFRAKPSVAAASACRVKYSDLRALIYFLGCGEG